MIVSLSFISILMLLAGISWDLYSHEYHRVKVQNTSDRAVLAAADLDQTLDPQEVVNDYFDKVGYPDLVANVTVETTLNSKTVSVSTDAVVSADAIAGNYTGSAFMGGRAEEDLDKIVDERTMARVAANYPDDQSKSNADIRNEEEARYIDEVTENGNFLKLRTFAEAEERIENVEISLVLDISGSMGSANKIQNMRDASKTFVNSMLSDGTADRVSINLIPYSEHVSAGPDIMAQYNVDWDHSYSHCIDFQNSDFDTTEISNSVQHDQVQHFYWGNSNWNSRTNPVCPDGQYEDIAAFSQNATALSQQIDRLEPRGSTSIFAGMKWAAGMLDPAFRQVNQGMSTSDPAFSNRPVDFNDEETLKTIILMTDGQNHWSYRINPQVYANASHAQHWNRNNLDWWLWRNVRSRDHDVWKNLKYSPSIGDGLLGNVCDAAKEKNIVIFSVGFEVTDHSANVMRNCASSPSHYFDVEGTEITEAFKAIARQINQLRLTQ